MIVDYNQSYESFTPDQFEPQNIAKVLTLAQSNVGSILDFLRNYFEEFNMSWEGKKVLDLGCGLGGLGMTLSRKGADVSGIDISSLAISCAKKLAEKYKMDIDWIVGDVTNELNINQKFDYIIDSHLYHCLTTKEQREAYIKFVSKHLSPKGNFFLETMLFHKNISVPFDFYLNEEFILHQEISGQQTPIRKIATNLMIEKEFLNSDLNIKYLYCHSELNFQAFKTNSDVPAENLPHVLRMVATNQEE